MIQCLQEAILQFKYLVLVPAFKDDLVNHCFFSKQSHKTFYYKLIWDNLPSVHTRAYMFMETLHTFDRAI